jgi:hypothetical protein
MTAILILNVVFAVFVAGGIVALLGRAIVADNPGALKRVREPAPAKPVRSARRALRSAFDLGG